MLFISNRSTLSEGSSNKTSSKNIVLTRAGSSPTQILVPSPIRKLANPKDPFISTPLTTSSTTTSTLPPITTYIPTTQLYSLYQRVQSINPHLKTNNKHENSELTSKNYENNIKISSTETDTQTTNIVRNISSLTNNKFENDRNMDQYEITTTIKTELEQRKKILNYIVSELQPQSFKVPSTTSSPIPSTTSTTINLYTTSNLLLPNSTPSYTTPSSTSHSPSFSNIFLSTLSPSPFHSSKSTYNSDSTFRNYNSNNNAFVNTPNSLVKGTSMTSILTTPKTPPPPLLKLPNTPDSFNRYYPSSPSNDYNTQSSPPLLSSYHNTRVRLIPPYNNNNNNKKDNSTYYYYDDDKYNSFNNNTTNKTNRFSSESSGQGSTKLIENEKPIEQHDKNLDELPVRSFKPDQIKFEDTIKSTSVSPLIEATTYTSPTNINYSKKLILQQQENQTQIVRNSQNDNTIIPTRFPPRTTLTSINNNNNNNNTGSSDNNYKTFTESFTSRGLIFKENLNKKNFEPSSQIRQIISPYKSLATQRQSTPDNLENSYSLPRNSSLNSSRFTYKSNNVIKSSSSYDDTTPNAITTRTIPSTITEELTTTVTTAAPTTVTPSIAMSTTTNSQYHTSTLPNEFSTSYDNAGETTTSPTKSSEHNRGRYRPYQTYSTTRSNLDLEEPTTYSTKFRFNVRQQPNIEKTTPVQEKLAATTTDVPIRRKILRQRPTVSNFVTTIITIVDRNSTMQTTTATPQITKSSPNKYYYSDHDKTVQEESGRKLNDKTDAPNDDTISETSQSSSVVEITDKPIYYTRFRYVQSIRNNTAKDVVTPSNTISELINEHNDEITTKKFRATVEMPEMKVPSADELLVFENVKINNNNNGDGDGDDDGDDDVSDTEENYHVEEDAVENESSDEENDDDAILNENESNALNNDAVGENDLADYVSKEDVVDTIEPTSILPKLGGLNITITTLTPPTTTINSEPITIPTTTTTSSTTTTTMTPTTKTTIPSIRTITTLRTLLKGPVVNSNIINNPKSMLPPRVSRVNNAIKTTIAAGQPRRPSPSKHNKCIENSANAKCNEIPSRYFFS